MARAGENGEKVIMADAWKSDCQRMCMVAAENLEDIRSGQDARTQIISYADVRDRLSGRRRHQMDVQ
jgi:hypothetical protein